MNYRGSVGLALRKTLDRTMSRAWFPLTRYVPRGVNPWYDMQRFAGRKSFDCIFDVGANIGQTARQLLRYFAQAHIYSFEPAHDTYQQLVGVSRLHPNLHCVNCALGSRAGEGRMAVYANTELNTLRPDAARWGPPERTDTVTIDTLDRFCESRSIRSIDILKMDVQGLELGDPARSVHAVREAGGALCLHRGRVPSSGKGHAVLRGPERVPGTARILILRTVRAVSLG